MATPHISSRLTRKEVKKAPGVAWLGLHNPPLNIIDIPLMEELAQALAEIEGRADISVVLLGGEGKGFSAGVDIMAHTPENIEEMLGKFHAVIRALVTSKKVIVAAVHGHCLGGGAELAMVCDMVFTTESAQWGFPEIQLGCYPPVACTALAALVGQKRAAEMILTGRTIGGREATEIGLANRTVAVENLGDVVEECAWHLSCLSPAALAITKKAMYAWDSMHFDKGLARAEKIYFEELMKTADAQEGIVAFLDKRKPKWTGK